MSQQPLDNTKVFNIKNGIIIISQNANIVNQLFLNANFQHFGTYNTVHIFNSVDLQDKLAQEGLPIHITKYIVNLEGYQKENSSQIAIT